MSEKKILVPNIGDFKNVEVIEVLVKSGQQIKKNDPLITLESDKSSVEVPATDEGKINKISIKVGDKVSEGTEILSLETIGKKEESKKIAKVKENITPKEVVEDTPKEIWGRARAVFIESVQKPDNALRGCAHNQKCYNELMEIRKEVVAYVQTLRYD